MAPKSGWRLTVRHGSKVDRESFERADEAIDALERRAEAIVAQGPLETATGFRDYEPSQQVAARLELSGPRQGLISRGREAGLDVMGDGSLVGYTGAIFKQRLEGDAVAGLRAALLD